MESTSYFARSPYVDELSPQDFNNVATWKLKKPGCTAVLFYAPWCPHCKAVKDDWLQLGKTATFMRVAAFNCEKYSAYLSKIKEDMPNLVTGFPTIIYYINGTPQETHAGARSFEHLLKTGMAFCQRNH